MRLKESWRPAIAARSNKSTAVRHPVPYTFVHGYVLRRGVFQTVDFPGAKQSSVRGINLAGDIAGAFSDAADVLNAFVKVGDRFEQVDPPGSTPTPPSGVLPFTAVAEAHRINNRGMVVGDDFDADSVAHAFVLTCADED